MRKKILVAMVVLMVVSSLLVAADFGVGVVLNYPYMTAGQEGAEDNFIPGLRAEWYLADILGVSADLWYLGTATLGEDEISFGLGFLNVNARLTLGALEPYVALGPGFLVAWDDENFETGESALTFNVRGGLDFNVLSNISVGAELSLLVQDLEAFFADPEAYFTEDYLNQNAFIGLSAKFKF